MSIQHRPQRPSVPRTATSPRVSGPLRLYASEIRQTTALERRLSEVRWSAAAVLAGFLLNAGIAVLLVSWISGSTVTALMALGVMAAFVLALALFGETFRLSVTGAQPLGPGEYPWLQAMVRDLAQSIGMDVPAVYVAHQDGLNAYTTGTGTRTKVVFLTGLLEKLTPEEVRAVAAHELGHAVNRDLSLGVWTWAVSVWVFAVSVLAFILARFIFTISKELPSAAGSGSGALGELLSLCFAALGFVIGALIWGATFAWGLASRLGALAVTRQREFLADATAVAITGDPRSLVSALGRIQESPQMAHGSEAVAQFCIMSPIARSHWWEELASTHPAPERRIEAIEALAVDDLPSLDTSWQGIGGETWVLPAGALAVLVILAAAIPVLD